MRRERNLRMILMAGAMLALGAARGQAQVDADQAVSGLDDASRGVARISVMEGSVSVKRGDAGEWIAGVINAPLMAGDHVSTAPNSRAEVQFDAANVLRIGGNAEVSLATLESGRFQVDVAHGTVTYAVLRASSANIEVDTPSVSVRPSGQGAYRISVNDSGMSQITARSGQAEIFTPSGSQSLSAGQTLQARGTQADPEYQIGNALPMDDWDRWNQQRDQVLTRARSAQYVPQGVYGAEDLDNYGTWNNVAPYGQVWTPTVAAGWAPYRAGRWAWLDWYGWTWVSNDPWGWAPYHYGRWFWDTGFGWSWYPGAFGARHYWSPALVGFFGYGRGVGFGFGFGNVGWVPLAPFEVFHPWWGRGFYGRGFNERINITNVNVYNGFRNARFNGVSGLSANDFRSGHFTGIGAVSAAHVQSAGLVRGQVPIEPAASHLQFANHAASFVPRSSGNTQVFRSQQPAAAGRVSFAQQQRAFGQAGQSGGSQAPARGPNVAQQSGPAGGEARSPQTNSGGWRRFGEPSGQAGGPAASPNQRGGASSPANQNTRPPGATNSGGGWGSFGAPRSAGQAQAPARSEFQGGSANSAPRNSAPAAPPVTRERSGAPGYSAPRYSAPSAPAAPRYSAPSAPSAPRYSAPSRPSGGGGGGSRPSGGGGGSRSSGGGGRRR